MVRIYPVLVIKILNWKKNIKEEYQPLSVVQTVEICKDIVTITRRIKMLI